MDFYFFMEFIGQVIIIFFPTRKNREISRKIRLLKKDESFKTWRYQFNLFFLFNEKVRDFIYKELVEDTLKNKDKKQDFFNRLGTVCKQAGY